MSSFSTYIIGFVIFVIGLALGAYLLNVPAMWIAVGVVVLIGIGVLMATSRTKPRDPPAASRRASPWVGGQGPGAKGRVVGHQMSKRQRKALAFAFPSPGPWPLTHDPPHPSANP